MEGQDLYVLQCEYANLIALRLKQSRLQLYFECRYRQVVGISDFSERSLALSLGLTVDTVREASAELRERGLMARSGQAVMFTFALLPCAHKLNAELTTDSRRGIQTTPQILKLLAQQTKAKILTALAHLIRCTFRKGNRINLYGLVSTTWIKRVFGISVEAVKKARRWMKDIGLLFDQQAVPGWAVNKQGGGFIINLRWKPGKNTPPRGKRPYILITRSSGDCERPDYRNITERDLKSQARQLEIAEQLVTAGEVDDSIDGRALVLAAFVAAGYRVDSRISKSRGALVRFIVKHGRFDIVRRTLDNAKHFYRAQLRRQQELEEARRRQAEDDRIEAENPRSQRKSIYLWEQVRASNRQRAIIAT